MICTSVKEDELNCIVDFYSSVEQIDKNLWSGLVNGSNVYLTLDYLEALELALKDQVQFRYMIFRDEAQNAIAASVTQIIHIKEDQLSSQKPLQGLVNKFKTLLVGSLDMKIIVSGNAFSTGENGFVFKESIPPEEAYNLLAKGLNKLKAKEREKQKIAMILFKETWKENWGESDQLKNRKFTDFNADVNMVLYMHPEWKSFEDYLSSMITKFRTKAKGVYKKSSSLRWEKFDEEEIRHHKEAIEVLYSAVQEKAYFKLGKLNGDAFYFFKKCLKENFILTGYFLDDKLVGFITAFISKDIVDTNYVGINYDLNMEHAIYQRMIYDLIDHTIQLEKKELWLGRTAEVLKSGVGAVPHEMRLYLKHTNPVTNKIVAPIIRSIKPTAFELRNPFKKEFLEQ